MNIKNTLRKEGGFTIVELLIVVVVIAILAAITIVSYNGITTQANASAAKSLAASWQKKVELYQADQGAYPTTKAQLNADSAKPYHMPTTSMVASTTTLDETNGKTTVHVQACGAGAGVVITYFQYTPASTASIDVGDVTGTCEDLT